MKLRRGNHRYRHGLVHQGSENPVYTRWQRARPDIRVKAVMRLIYDHTQAAILQSLLHTVPDLLRLHGERARDAQRLGKRPEESQVIIAGRRLNVTNHAGAALAAILRRKVFSY